MRCKHCFSSLDSQSSVCNVCKIDNIKDKSAITKDEKTIIYYCRTLNVIGFLAIIGGLLGILGALTLFLGKGTQANFTFTVANFIFGGLFIVFGFSVRTYQKWCYIGGIALYSIAVIFGFVEGKILSILLGILFLYYIASPTSKRILYRQIK